MRLLILGGTIFLGRHLVDTALAAGHDVTIFHRGTHDAPLPDGVERVLGDRTTDLGRLSGRTWDAVIDTCGYVPRVVRASTEALADACEHYTFVSSISAFGAPYRPGMTEEHPVATIDDPTVEEITGETYGALKALCERAAEDVMPARVCVVRPGLIVGPFDPSERYTYWPRRIARGGEILVPGDGSGLVRFIDARDLAAWIVRAAEQRLAGVFTADGPAEPITWRAFIDRTVAALGSDARPVWVDEGILRAHDVAPWLGLPMWLPSDSDDANLSTADCSKAIAAGLTYRPIEDTARDTLAWDQTRPAEQKGGAAITAEAERAVLDAWATRRTPSA